MAITNPHTSKISTSTTVTGVDTNADGDVTVTLGALRGIESAADVGASASGGYVANVQSVNGNEVTIRIYEDAGAAGELAAVADTAGVTDVHVSAEGY